MYDELTQQDIDKLKEELEHRITVIRAELHTKIVEAKEFGDLSENAEYHEARREKGRNESRIEYLQAMIKTAKIITAKNDGTTVGINHKFEVLFEDDDSTEIVQLSTTVGQDAKNGIYSKESPFGQAVLGKKIGERAEVKVNENCSYYVKILSILD